MTDPRLSVLAAHRDTGLGTCSLGCDTTGQSHPEHVAALLDAADLEAGWRRIHLDTLAGLIDAARHPRSGDTP